MHNRLRSGKVGFVSLVSEALQAELGRTDLLSYDESYDEFVLGRWQSCMLFNQTGTLEKRLGDDQGRAAIATPIAKTLPYLEGLIMRTFDRDQLRFARLARLFPRTVLVPHRDYLELNRPLRRVHVPLVTDAQCFLGEEDVVYRMADGEIWYLDATQLHSAASFSDQHRVHLILDFCDADNLGTIAALPLKAPSIPRESIAPRRELDARERRRLKSLADVIDNDNYRDIMGILVRIFFRVESSAGDVFRWLIEIAQQRGDPALLARAQRDYQYFAQKR